MNADEPSRPPLGGINLGVSAYSEKPDLAFRAARCLAQPENQVVAAEKGGLPPTTESLYDDPKVKKAYPFGDLLARVDRGRRAAPGDPAYSDISLAIQKSFHPPDEHRAGRDRVQAQGAPGQGGGGKIF